MDASGDHYDGERNVAGASSIKEDELPPPSFTRHLLDHFKSIEDLSKPQYTASQETFASREKESQEYGNGRGKSFQQNDGAHQSRAQNTSGSRETERKNDSKSKRSESGGRSDASWEVENESAHATAVVRESDRNEEDDLPEQGTTRNLLARFQSLQTPRQ